MKYTGERVIPEEEFCGPKTNIYKEHVARYQFASKYTKSKKVLDVACGSGYGSEILSESDDENELETFYDEYVLEVDNNEKKVELSVLLEKYNNYCETNNMEKDEEGLETFLVEKLGKPKGKKKPKFVGVELKA